MITPIGDKVVVQATEATETTAGGIVLPDSAKKKPQEGKVVAVGQGRVLDNRLARELSAQSDMVLLCGHYEGVDQRALDACVDMEISIGDYVLTGGELPALVLLDAVSRFIPGVLGNDDAQADESFENGLLEYPQYTRPASFRGRDVPEVLLNGNHAHIQAWRQARALEKTRAVRADLAEKYDNPTKP